MKKSTGILERISKEELDNMAREIKETLDLKHSSKHRAFSSVDLWNIQRSRKTISFRRHFV